MGQEAKDGNWKVKASKGFLEGTSVLALHVPPPAPKALCSPIGSGEGPDLFDVDLHNIKVRLIAWISGPFVPHFLSSHSFFIQENRCSPLDQPSLTEKVKLIRSHFQVQF